jgi:hypothetical protein
LQELLHERGLDVLDFDAGQRVVPALMGPLMFVNWETVNVRFTASMWAIALVLAIAILLASAPTHAQPHRSLRAPAPSTAALDGRQ